MLVALIPLFDENMAVRAYSIFAQKDNFFLDPMMQGTRQNDGAAAVFGLELIEEMGIETISEDSEIFVPVSNISIFSDVQDYVLLNNRKIAIDKAKIYFGKLYPNVKLVAGNISDMGAFERLKAVGGYQLYEGDFYRVPVTKGNHEISPLKVNYIALMNSVNSENFDLADVSEIIGRDPALTISLLQMVNRMTINSGISTIRHAAAMLGQKELRKWINTAVVKEMYSDKPSEITRLSLLRAKFAESLAAAFDMQAKQEELFLMGLVSVLDVILEKPMQEALEMVKVTGEVSDALVKGEGDLAKVLNLMMQYENANWQEVTRLMLLADVDLSVINDCYVKSLKWYRELMYGKN